MLIEGGDVVSVREACDAGASLNVLYQGLLVHSVCRCEQLTSDVFLLHTFTVTLKSSSHLQHSTILLFLLLLLCFSAKARNKMLGKLQCELGLVTAETSASHSKNCIH